MSWLCHRAKCIVSDTRRGVSKKQSRHCTLKGETQDITLMGYLVIFLSFLSTNICHMGKNYSHPWFGIIQISFMVDTFKFRMLLLSSLNSINYKQYEERHSHRNH